MSLDQSRFGFPDGLRFFYQDALDSLRQFKSQQWQVAYYAVILNSGLLYLFLSNSLPFSERLQLNCAGVCLLLSGLIFLGAVCVLCSLQRGIARRREAFEKLGEELPEDTKRLWIELFRPANHDYLLVLIMASPSLFFPIIYLLSLPA